MKAYEIRSMTDSEIEKKITDTYQEIFNLRFQVAIGQAKNTNQVRFLRRDIARMKTILNERKLLGDI